MCYVARRLHSTYPPRNIAHTPHAGLYPVILQHLDLLNSLYYIFYKFLIFIYKSIQEFEFQIRYYKSNY